MRLDREMREGGSRSVASPVLSTGLASRAERGSVGMAKHFERGGGTRHRAKERDERYRTVARISPVATPRTRHRRQGLIPDQRCGRRLADRGQGGPVVTVDAIVRVAPP